MRYENYVQTRNAYKSCQLSKDKGSIGKVSNIVNTTFSLGKLCRQGDEGGLVAQKLSS